MVAARQIKHTFTGDLNASIKSNPPFPGKERHFLRAQLARIVHSTSIMPAGMLTQEEDDNGVPETKFTEGFEFPAVQDLTSFDKW